MLRYGFSWGRREIPSQGLAFQVVQSKRFYILNYETKKLNNQTRKKKETVEALFRSSRRMFHEASVKIQNHLSNSKVFLFASIQPRYWVFSAGTPNAQLKRLDHPVVYACVDSYSLYIVFKLLSHVLQLVRPNKIYQTSVMLALSS